MINSSCIHVTANGAISVIKKNKWYSIVYVYHIFIHSSVDGHLGCYHVLPIVNSATMNIGVQVSFRIRVLSGYMPRSGTAGEKAILMGISRMGFLVVLGVMPPKILKWFIMDLEDFIHF